MNNAIMVKSVVLVGALVGLGSSALADVRVHNATTGELRVEVVYPNGAVKADTLSANTDSLDSSLFSVGPGIKQLTIRVLDDAGQVRWSAKVKDNDVYLLIPKGDGVSGVFAGTYTVAAEASRAVFMNLTGQPVVLDLVGNNGLGAHRGVKPPATFNPKAPVKLDARETYFQATGKVAGEVVEFDVDRVNRAYYYVVWQVPRSGKYRVEALGRLK